MYTAILDLLKVVGKDKQKFLKWLFNGDESHGRIRQKSRCLKQTKTIATWAKLRYPAKGLTLSGLHLNPTINSKGLRV